ncbi:hypothetical protein BC628DRAFT_1414831 [Trametes gibbosa]|nr:hypothetical protein BC628DRAFT_1414831 [Trametes gibbosa]
MERVRPQSSGGCAAPGCQNLSDQGIACSRCKNVYYCSRKHQITDVKRHKSLCVNPASLVINTVPEPITCDERKRVDAILFPMNGLPPRIVSLECSVQTSTIWHGLKEDTIDFNALLESPIVISGAIGSTNRSSTHPSRLYLVLVDQRTNDKPRNECIYRYSKGRHDYTWTGDAIGVRRREPTTKYVQYLDVTQQDIAPFATYFQEYGTARAPEIPDVVMCLATPAAKGELTDMLGSA